MKTSFLLCLLLSIYSLDACSQEIIDIQIRDNHLGGGHHCEIIGDKSSKILDELLHDFPKTKRRGYSWKFKNVDVPELNYDGITLVVHQGALTELGNGRSTFKKFKSKKNKSKLLAQKNGKTQIALMIYPRTGSYQPIISEDEVQFVRAYLEYLYFQ